MSATYVVSDVHGYLDDFRTLLRDAGLIDGSDRWVDGEAQLWVLGDLVDRGPDGIGTVRFVRALQEQAPAQVHMLMGNHEALMLGFHRFPDTRFAEVWSLNGGHRSDQDGLTEDDVAWLRALPAMAVVDDHLLVHADTTDYLAWGSTVDEVNATVARLLAGDDAQEHFDVFAGLTSRYDFLEEGGVDAARSMLDAFGGSRIVHGHSIIATLTDLPSSRVETPISYAEELVVAIDGGRYDGGPLLLLQIA